jgi:glycosyltransferase involved in cell wall biosynthesis
MPTDPNDGPALKPERGAVTVCVPIDEDRSPAALERIMATLESVIEHTASSTPLLLAGPPAQIGRVLSDPNARFGLGGPLKDLHVLELESDTSDTEAVNAAIDASFPCDVAFVTAGVEVTSDWLRRLQAAALSDSTVASATPLSLGLDGIDVLGDLEPIPAQHVHGLRTKRSISELADRVREHSPRLRARIATIGPGCAYIRRSAVELIGKLKEPLALDVALRDLAIRAIAAGMVHVVADDVLVAGGRNSISGSTIRETALDEALTTPEIVDEVSATIIEDDRGCLRRTMNIARTALRAPSVTIDGRSLTSVVGGTQTYILELIAALRRTDSISLRVLVAHDLSERAQSLFANLPDVELVSYEQALSGVPLTDVVHRPQQVFTPEDLTLLKLVGRRIVIGQQDLIAYHNYTYHADIDRWRAYRRTTRLALTAADQVIFFSEHARRDALAEDLLPDARTHVVGVGADAPRETGTAEARPVGAPDDRGFLLCIGADYAHKNRPFAIELAGALHERGWTGALVFAGSHVANGSSRDRERELLELKPGLAERIIDVGAVDEPGKRWLYMHAQGLVYPTVYEGFGLVPVEAARAGLPCLFAPQASLTELAGQAATLLPWDPHASAVAVLPLLADGPERRRHLGQLRALELPSWEDTAKQLVEVYERAIAEPPSEAAGRAWQDLDRESFIVRLDEDVRHFKDTAQEYQDAYHSLSARVASGLPLIDEGGLLSPAEQRGLMRIASRRLLRGPILGPVGLLGHRSSFSRKPSRPGDRTGQ